VTRRPLADHVRVVILLRRGLTLAETAAASGVPRSLVHRWATRYGVPFRQCARGVPSRLSRACVAEMQRQREGGESIRAIAERFNVAPSYADRMLKRGRE
jgi:transposase